MEAISLHFLAKVLIIFSIIWGIWCTAILRTFLKELVRVQDRKVDLRKYEIDINANVAKEIDEKLDVLIEQCFMEYSILNLAYKSDYYITEEDEIKIQKDIANLVAERLSPVFLEQLGLYYNEDAVLDTISKRVYFRVTNFVMEHNGSTGL